MGVHEDQFTVKWNDPKIKYSLAYWNNPILSSRDKNAEDTI